MLSHLPCLTAHFTYQHVKAYISSGLLKVTHLNNHKAEARTKKSISNPVFFFFFYFSVAFDPRSSLYVTLKYLRSQSVMEPN